MDMRVRFFLVAAAGFALLSSCASANAANIIVGNPLLNWSKYSTGCGGLSAEGCTFVTLELPKSAGLVQSPVDGAIIRWSMRGARPEPGYAIRVLEARGGLEFTGAGTSTPVTPTSEGVETFNASLPIHAGGYIGLKVPEEGRIDMNKVPGSEFGFFGPFPDGSTKHTGSFEGELAYYAEVQPAPAVTNLDPATGPTSGGTVVRITGSDFKDVTNVKFGTLSAASFNVESEGSLTAVAPPVPSPQFVHVSVTTIAGSSESTFHDYFEYIPSPAPLATTAANPPMCVVPKVLGKKLRGARKRARRAHCAIGHILGLKRATAQTGRIVRQRPKPGEKRRAGARIAVTLR